MTAAIKGIREAHAELSPRAFASWVRLMVATPEESRTMGALAKALCLNERHLYRVLNELEMLGYVDRRAGGLRVVVVLGVFGPNKIVRL